MKPAARLPPPLLALLLAAAGSGAAGGASSLELAHAADEWGAPINSTTINAATVANPMTKEAQEAKDAVAKEVKDTAKEANEATDTAKDANYAKLPEHDTAKEAEGGGKEVEAHIPWSLVDFACAIALTVRPRASRGRAGARCSSCHAAEPPAPLRRWCPSASRSVSCCARGGCAASSSSRS